MVAGLASAMGATVRLLHVEPEAREFVDQQGRVIVYIDQDAARVETDGMDYLADMAGRLPRVAVERAVRFGDPVKGILDEAESFGADLIAVTTTGRSGLRRAVLGSVAEQVFNRASVPVMLYHNSAPGH